MAVTSLEEPNADWTIDALEGAFEEYGAPKHIISDQARVFTDDAYADLLDHWDVKPRFGAVGKHGSIAVTERVNKTLKYEWLMRVPVIMGFDHLSCLCNEFSEWYNRWRPHMRLDGSRPDDVYIGKDIQRPGYDAKMAPQNIEQRVFCISNSVYSVKPVSPGTGLKKSHRILPSEQDFPWEKSVLMDKYSA